MVTFFGAMQGSITAVGPASLVLLPALSRGSSVCRSMFPQSPELGFITQVRWDMCLALSQRPGSIGCLQRTFNRVTGTSSDLHCVAATNSPLLCFRLRCYFSSHWQGPYCCKSG